MITSKSIKVNSTITLLQETLFGMQYYTLIDTSGKYNLLFEKFCLIENNKILTYKEVLYTIGVFMKYVDNIKLRFSDYNKFALILNKKYNCTTILCYHYDKNIIDDRTYKLITILKGDCDISTTVEEAISKSLFEVTMLNWGNDDLAFQLYLKYILEKKLKIKFIYTQNILKGVCKNAKDFYKLTNFFDILNI